MSVIRDYFLAQENQLDSDFKGSVVVGHNPNTGENREEIIRKWLEKHIPRKVTAESGGKILDATGYLSDQVDLTIYDSSVPRFGAYPKSYFFAEGVNVAIQVKSILTSKELSSAVKNLSSVKKCHQNFGGGVFHGDPNSGIVTGVFAFDTNYSSSKAIVKSLKNMETKGISPIDFVCINKHCYIAHNPGNWINMETNEPLPKGYIVVDNGIGAIWRLVLAIASETKRVISSTPDFQKYFLMGTLPPSTVK